MALSAATLMISRIFENNDSMEAEFWLKFAFELLLVFKAEA